MRWPRSFRGRLGLVAAGALLLRVVVILTVARRNPDGGDPLFYHQQANLLAAGQGFLHPFEHALFGRSVATAVHPPLFSLVLAVPSLVGADGFLAHKLTMALAGTATVVVVGLVARRVAGERAGLLAAAVAALYPNLWAPEGILMPEAPFALTVAAVLLLAYRLHDRPSLAAAALLGAGVGLAALTRGEGILLLPLIAVAVPLLLRGLAPRRRLALAGVAVAGTVLVVAPWTVRNLVRFDEPVLISVSGDEVIGYANCDETYSGDGLGFWFLWCLRDDPPGDESARGRHWRRQGLDYARDHLDRLPVVLAARVGRVWDVYRPVQGTRLSTIEGRSLAVTRAGLASYAVLLPTAVAGVVVLRRRRVLVWPLVAPAVLVTVTALYAYGTTRFRVPAEVSIAVLAGVTLDALVSRLRDTSPGPASP